MDTTLTDSTAACPECDGGGSVRSPVYNRHGEPICDVDVCPRCVDGRVPRASVELTLYRLTWTETLAARAPQYDVAVAMIIAATSERAARAIASEHCSDECEHRRHHALPSEPAAWGGPDCVWTGAEDVACAVIGTAAKDVPEGLVMRAFNAG